MTSQPGSSAPAPDRRPGGHHDSPAAMPPGPGASFAPSPAAGSEPDAAGRARAARALTLSCDLLAWSEQGIRHAAAALNDAIDAAHAAGIPAEAAQGLVTSRATLGMIGRAYLNREIRWWDDIYENGPRPVNQYDTELLDLHARPRPGTPDLPAGWERSVPGALASAGQGLSHAETAFEQAYARFSDAADYAQHAGLTQDQAAALITSRSAPLGRLSRELVTAEAGDWDAAITLDLADELADGTEPAEFWAAARNARSAKGAGDHGAAAAAWTLARGRLPDGHLMRDGLDSLIFALHAARIGGEHVTRAGYIAHHSTTPARPAGWQVQAVREHASRLGDDKQGLRMILSQWSDGEIAAAFDNARDPGEAIARACLFATFERADRLRAHGPRGKSFPGPPAPQPPGRPAAAGLPRAGRAALPSGARPPGQEDAMTDATARGRRAHPNRRPTMNFLARPARSRP
jgi:hypothetical protein